MPARKKRIFHDENTRLKIQTSQLINRLTKHILAEPTSDEDKEETKKLMSPSQVTAALGLLKKTLPDLTAVEHSGEVLTSHASELTESDIIRRIEQLRGDKTADGVAETEEGAKLTH